MSNHVTKQKIKITREIVDQLITGSLNDLESFIRDIRSEPALVVNFEYFYSLIIKENLESVIDSDVVLKSFEFKNIEDKIHEAHGSLLQHVEAVPKHRLNGIFLEVSKLDDFWNVEVGWMDGIAGRCLWDRFVVENCAAMAFISTGNLFDYKKYKLSKSKPKQTEPALYRYHPERFAAYYPIAHDVSSMFRNRVDFKSGLMDMNQLNFLTGKINEAMNKSREEKPLREVFKKPMPSPSLHFNAITNLATAYGRFVQAGRQIITFPKELISMFEKTDADDIPMTEIKLPYSSQYISFSSMLDLEIEPGWLVDGVYVESRGELGDMRFTVTAVPLDKEKSKDWAFIPEPQFSQDFIKEYRGMNVGQAIDTAAGEIIADLQKHIEGGIEVQSVEMELSNSGAIDISKQTAANRLEQIHHRLPIYKKALQITINALCYITAYPDDIDREWPEGTPDRLREKSDGNKGKESLRAKSKLKSLGYVPVHICGKNIVQNIKVITGDSPDQNSTHWRKGHWRNQPHGRQRKLRKLIWIMPSLIGGEKAESGHIYVVAKPNEKLESS